MCEYHRFYHIHVLPKMLLLTHEATHLDKPAYNRPDDEIIATNFWGL